MILKQLFFVMSMFLVSSEILAQVEEQINPEEKGRKERSAFGERLVFGGDIGLSFGTITYIKIAPVIGYRVTPRFTAGLGPIYIYEKYKNIGLESSSYGGKAITSFAIWRGTGEGGTLPFGTILLHAENEIVSVEPMYVNFNGIYATYFLGERVWIDNLLVGGGLSQPIAGRFNISVFVLWDITRNKYSPYTNPIFKFGFNF